MAKVRANQRGYYGKQIREPGDVFTAEGKASWFDPVGGAVKEEAAPANDAPPSTDPLEALTVKELRDMAKDKGIPLGADVKTKAEVIAAINAATQPVRVENEVAAITGSTQPDWVAG